MLTSPIALLTLLPQEAAAGPSLAALDYVGLGIVGVLIVLGIVRGMWWQVIRLLGVLAAVLVAGRTSPIVAEWVRGTWTELDPRIASGASWLAVFLLALGAASLLGHLGQRLIEAMQLGLLNRLGGGAVGALTGVLVHLALLVVVCWLAPEAFLGRYVSGSYSEQLVQTVGGRWHMVLGAETAEDVERILERVPPAEEGGGGVR